MRDANRSSKGVSFTVTAPRGGDAGLVGSWHDNSLLGWSEMYKFTAAGTFSHVITNTEQTSKTVGLYRARGDKIRLFSQWSDDGRVPNDSLTYSYRDFGKTLVIGSGAFRERVTPVGTGDGCMSTPGRTTSTECSIPSGAPLHCRRAHSAVTQGEADSTCSTSLSPADSGT